MKKICFLLLAALILFTVTGCAQEITFTSGFTQDEEILCALTNSCSQYKYSGGSGYYMTLWMERYEYGELVESTPDLLSCSCGESGHIIFYSNRTNDNDDEMLNVVIVSGYTLDENYLQLDALDLMDMNESNALTFASMGEFTAKDGANIILYYAGFSQPIDVYVPEDFFTDYQDYLDILTDVPVVVLIGCQFTTEEPANAE